MNVYSSLNIFKKMRKKVVDKAHYLPITPSLTERKMRNFQEILDKKVVEETKKIAEILSIETRLKILYLLSLRNNLCVNDIADILRSEVSGVSHQLAVLRKERLVKANKRRRVVYYSLAEKLPDLVLSALKSCDV